MKDAGATMELGMEILPLRFSTIGDDVRKDKVIIRIRGKEGTLKRWQESEETKKKLLVPPEKETDH